MNNGYNILVFVALGIMAIAFLATPVYAVQDFSQYSNEELVQMRSQASTMDKGERARYEQELQSRLRNMSAAERKQLGMDDNKQQSGSRVRTNEDNTMGQGSLDRNRERTESNTGYGKGFDSRHGGGGRGR